MVSSLPATRGSALDLWLVGCRCTNCYVKRQRAHVAIHHRKKRKWGKAQRCTPALLRALGLCP